MVYQITFNYHVHVATYMHLQIISTDTEDFEMRANLMEVAIDKMLPCPSQIDQLCIVADNILELYTISQPLVFNDIILKLSPLVF